MYEIRKNINKLKEVLGYELDYDWGEEYPEIKKEPDNLTDKDKAILNVLESIENRLKEMIEEKNGYDY